MQYDPPLQEHELQSFRKLFAVESVFMASEGYFQNRNIANFRQFAVSFIEEISKCENFDAFVPYLALNYFDRFISRHELPRVVTSTDEENAILLVISCLTIAWKMRIKSFNADLFMTARKLRLDRISFRKMEFHILNALQWRMLSLTPICFAKYFMSLLNLTPWNLAPNQRSVYEIIIRGQAEIEFTQFKPSIIAASAVLTTSLKLFPSRFEELKVTVSSSEFVSQEELLQCMNLMEMKCKTASSALLLPAQQPGAGSSVQSQEENIHRVGKKTVGEIEEVPAVAASSDNLFHGPLMNFELQWTDPQQPRPKLTSESIFPGRDLSDDSCLRSSRFGGFFKCCPILDWLA
ncbi:putative cyclin-D6-1 [Diospyros lotus]|uniref:putative cyclin-D6-1 n=1 Tax=Diospyros lotus TaxID=55363 RepID=UPI00224CC9F1|nr:putative cyclin-D6-1 [Diospyros lotus]